MPRSKATALLSIGTLYVFYLLVMLLLHSPVVAIQLRTSVDLRGVSAREAHSFLASPINWPKIVASSHSVEAATKNGQTDVPMMPGEAVDEIFGLPPFIPLSVRWICEQSDAVKGDLAFVSPDGLRGIAKNCRMVFSIEENNNNDNNKANNIIKSSGGGCKVDFVMEYEPVSLLATLATPALDIDNRLAIKVLLPRAIQNAT